MNVAIKAPSISAVIPAYNAADSIAEAIQSILKQTHPVDEIIVVDDGSADQTAEIAAQFPHTQVIRQANAGAGATRNAGIQAASGEWIAFLDSDDVWVEHKTKEQLAWITPQAGVIHCNHFPTVTFGNLWHRQAYISPSGAMVRKQALLDAGCFEVSKTYQGVEDLNLWLKIASCGWQFVQSATGLFRYRPTAQSLSANELRMVRAELATIAMIGQRVQCPAVEMQRIQHASRIEYAKNLIACKKWEQARQLLSECPTSAASRWLSLAASLRVNRLARTNLIHWLQTLDPTHGTACAGTCSLPESQRRDCQQASCNSYHSAAIRRL